MMDDFASLRGFWKLKSSTRDGTPDSFDELGTLFCTCRSLPFPGLLRPRHLAQA